MSKLRHYITALTLSLLAGTAQAGPVVYSSNFGNNTVTAYDLASGALLGTPVTAGIEASGFNGIRIGPDGSFYLTAQNTNNILRYSGAGALLTNFDPANSANLNSPQDLVFGPDGKIYAVSSANDKILKFDPATGNFLGTFADLGGGGHVGPIGLAFGPDGNLYVTTFDDPQVIKLNGLTGAIIGSTPGPAGFGLATATIGPDGNLYFVGLDLNTFTGDVYKYNLGTADISLFISQGTGGLDSPGGLAFAPDGSLLVANLLFDQNFVDTGSSILRFNGTTGAPMGTLVGGGNGLDTPFFLTVTSVPEPSLAGLLAAGLLLLAWIHRNRAGLTRP